MTRRVRLTKPDPGKDDHALRMSYEYQSHAKEDHRQPIYAVNFCDCCPGYEDYFVTVGGNRVSVYQCLESGELDVVQTYVDGDANETFYTFTWTRDVQTGQPLLAVAGLTGHIKVIHVVLQRVVAILSGHCQSINELQRHPTQPSLLISGSKDESVRIWNIRTGVCPVIFSGHQGHCGDVLSVDVHFEGHYVVSSGMDNSIKIWDLKDAQVAHAIDLSYTEPLPAKGNPFPTQFIQLPVFTTTDVHSDYVDCVRFVGSLILSKSTANKIILWSPTYAEEEKKDATSLLILREYLFSNAELWFMKFSLDAKMLRVAVGNKNGRLFLWKIDQDIERPSCSLAHPNSKSTVRQTAFNESGSILISVCDDGSVWRWDLGQHP